MRIMRSLQALSRFSRTFQQAGTKRVLIRTAFPHSAAVRTISTSSPLSYWSDPLAEDTLEHEDDSKPDYLRMILSARVYDVAEETPLDYAPTLSKLTKNEIYLKREDLQPVFSFKIRGAYNKISSLPEEQLSRGIVACSAGNHAQGVALSAKRLQIQAKIVMPLATPAIKVNAVRHHGGEYGQVILHGLNYDEAAAEAQRLSQEHGYAFIHPFDDPLVIAGQGTVGLEVLKERTGKPLDAVFICCGGGGMLAGMGAYIKRLRPDVKVFGVEAADAPGMTASLQAGRRRELSHVGLFADGAAVKLIGQETFRLCSKYVDEMITVTTDEICAAIKDVFNDTRSILEPAGALAVAGMKKYATEMGVEGQTFVATASGANMDFDRLRFVSDRADTSETLISVIIPEKPGAFMDLHSLVHPRNVTEFSYRWNNNDEAHIFMSFQSRDTLDAADVISGIGSRFKVLDLSNNEMAKVHARHLIGGRSPRVENELLYRFEFPEKPGALRTFLQQLSAGWNVSLFHYRNHGADIGRVLVGIQVPPDMREEFQKFLQKLGYVYCLESCNPVYLQFLK